MLKTIDFRQSIRSDDIQHNFDKLHERLKSETLIAGGKGVIEGLVLSNSTKGSIAISSGRYIDASGDEVYYPGGSLIIEDIEPIPDKIEAKILMDGTLDLPQRPYSRSTKEYFTTKEYLAMFPTEELFLQEKDTKETVKISRIENNRLYFDENKWKGKTVIIQYLYAEDRVDTILISKDRGIYAPEGTMSASMSHSDIDDYPDAVVLGLVESQIEPSFHLAIHQNERQVRPIHVNQNNQLLLNGMAYRRLFFEMPDQPILHDVYIDYKNNDIYAYLDTDGEVGWEKVNGIGGAIKKEIKIYTPDAKDYPSNLQDFIFGKEEINYRFVPGQNQVEVIVDNAPLMSDQFVEQIDKNSKDINNGIGIRLNNKLDRAAWVEIRVTHNIEGGKARRAYQRTAVFSEERVEQAQNSSHVYFKTAMPYIAGENQLEVYLNGRKLNRDYHYKEVDDARAVAERGSTGTGFELYESTGVKAFDMITSKTMRNVYSYDHIVSVIEEAIGTVKDLDSKLDNFITAQQSDQRKNDQRLQEIENKLKNINADLIKENVFVQKSDKLERANLSTSITDSMKKRVFEEVHACESVISISGMKTTDFITLTKFKGDTIQLLLKDIDYSLHASGNDVLVTINARHVDSSASVLIKGVAFG